MNQWTKVAIASVATILLMGTGVLGHADPGVSKNPKPSPTEEQQAAIDRLSTLMQRSAQGAPLNPRDHAFVKDAGKLLQDSKRPDGAVGGALQQELVVRREAVSQLMGFNPSEATLYIFVSHSMATPMIKSYLREAIWTGATVVVRGIPPNKKMGEYLRETLWPIMKFTGSMGAFSINPPLYDMYGIDSVPAIVLDERDALDRVCVGYEATSVLPNKHSVQQKHCKAADPDSFWKIGGSVTVDWALEQFAKGGSKAAQQRLDIMRDKLGHTGQIQQPFTGDWSKVLRADDSMENDKIDAEIERRRRMDETLLSPVVEPVRH